MRKILLLTVMFTLSVSFIGCDGFNKKDDTKMINESAVVNQTTELLEKIDRNYTDWQAHYELGGIYKANGLYEKAYHEFNVANGFAPVNRNIQAAMVKSQILMGKESKGIVTAEGFINQTREHAEESLLLGRAFQKEDLDSLALNCYQNSLRLAPESPALHKQMGYYYLKNNNKSRAEEYFRKSFQLDPYQVDVSEQLGKMGVIVKVPTEPKKESIWQKMKKPFQKKNDAGETK